MRLAKWWRVILPLTAVVAVGCGIAGFLRASLGVWESLYRTADMFTGSYSAPDAGTTALLQIARFSALAATLSSIALLVLAVTRDTGDLIRIILARKHIIVVGPGRRATALAHAYTERGVTVGLLDPSGTAESTAGLRTAGVRVIGEHAAPSWRIRQVISHADKLVVATDDDFANAQVVRLLAAVATPATTCLASIDDTLLCEHFRDTLGYGAQSNGQHIDFVNATENAAQSAVRKLLTVAPKTGDEYFFALLGDGAFARCLLLQLRRLGAADPDRHAQRVTLIGPDSRQVLQDWISLRPELADGSGWSVIPQEMQLTGPASVNDALKVALPSLDAVLLAVNPTPDTLTTAQHLSAFVTVAAHVRGAKKLTGLLGGGPNLLLMDPDEEGLTPQLVNNDIDSLLGRAAHEFYRADDNVRTDVPWESLSPEKQRDNIEQVHDVRRSLAANGYEVKRSRSGSAIVELPPDIVEALAKVEHQRWVDARIKNGWSYAPVTDDKKKRHALLVSWDDLPTSPDEREKDRSAIRRFPLLVRSVGYELVPVSPAADN